MEETALVLPIILILLINFNIDDINDCKRVRTTLGATTTPVFRRFSSFSREEEEEEEEERIFFFECGN